LKSQWFQDKNPHTPPLFPRIKPKVAPSGLGAAVTGWAAFGLSAPQISYAGGSFDRLARGREPGVMYLFPVCQTRASMPGRSRPRFA